jgi:hypothetical protein
VSQRERPARRSPGGECRAGRAGQGIEARGIPGRVIRVWSLSKWDGPRLETKWKQWKLWNASKESFGGWSLHVAIWRGRR